MLPAKVPWKDLSSGSIMYELAARGIKAGKPGRLVLTACFMIEVIFWLEADFEYVDRAVLDERRKKYTSRQAQQAKRRRCCKLLASAAIAVLHSKVSTSSSLRVPRKNLHF